MLNRIVLMGRLTRDPELRRTQSGTAVVSSPSPATAITRRRARSGKRILSTLLRGAVRLSLWRSISAKAA
jgi:hypothetical protein